MKKELAIWLDHSKAYVMPHIDGQVEVSLLENKAKSRIRNAGEGNDETRFGGERSFSGNENRKNQIEKNELKEYLSSVVEVMRPYQHDIIYGPGVAKDQLRNVVAENKDFTEVLVETYPADKMTDNQLKAMVKDAFKKK